VTRFATDLVTSFQTINRPRTGSDRSLAKPPPPPSLLNDLTDVASGVPTPRPIIYNSTSSLWSAKGFSERQLVRYVDPAKSDTNTGIHPNDAMKTIQGAYDDLVTEAESRFSPAVGEKIFVGEIWLWPGLYDVGAGVTLDPERPCAIRGNNRYAIMTREKTTQNGQSLADEQKHGAISTIHSSTIDPTSFFDIDGDGLTNAGGFIFEGLKFFVNNDNDDPNDGSNPALQNGMAQVIRARSVSDMTIRDCNIVSSWNWSGYAINSDAATGEAHDNWHIENCRIGDIGFIKTGGTEIANGWTVTHCFQLSGLLSDKPAGIQLVGMRNMTIFGMEFDSGRVWIECGNNVEFCTFIDIHGEAGQWNEPSIRLKSGAKWNSIIGGVTLVTGGAGQDTGTWVQADSGSEGNIVKRPDLTQAGATNFRRDGYTDNGTNNVWRSTQL